MQSRDSYASLEREVLKMSEDDLNQLQEDSIAVIMPLLGRWLSGSDSEQRMAAAVLLAEVLRRFPRSFSSLTNEFRSYCTRALKFLLSSQDAGRLRKAGVDFEALAAALKND
mmetsp:Transcript_43528/g.70646  ORF Transcript_43528/g.70646 Transcript_43528/m.70646 type:complete len:112 (+) Transcript_43528:1058-1393(+)